MTDAEFAETLDPDEAFGILASEPRIEILRALWEAEDNAATFGELREAVGMADSGQFNYHLGAFDGQFVENADEEYRLTHAGVRVVGALVAGLYTVDGRIDPVDARADCPGCGGALSVAYESERATLECEDCGLLGEFGVRPGLVAGRDPGRLPAVVDAHARIRLRTAGRGFCPYCDGPVEERLTTAAETADERSSPPVSPEDVPMAVYECSRCGKRQAANLRIALLDHPAVVAFHHDHGVDYREVPLWTFVGLDPERAAVIDRDPVRASVTYRADGDDCTLVVEEDLTATVAEDPSVLADD